MHRRYNHLISTPAITVSTLLLSLILSFPPLAGAQTTSSIDVKALLRQFDELYESTGTRAQMEITIVKSGKTRTMKLTTWGKGADHSLIVIDAPVRDAGTATLKVEKNLWNYLPKISRTIRVPPSMMMGSWMGSDLTNDDLVRRTSYEEDYDAQLLEETAETWKVRVDAKPDVIGLWNRVDMIFSKKDRMPLQAQFYDRKDRLSRTMRFEDIKTITGRRIPMHITIIPEREEGRSTEVIYHHVEFNVQLDDNLFSLSRLERKR